MTTGERETKIREYLPLVRQIARRVLRVVAAPDLDDLVGDGSIGLIRAVDTFDSSRGTTLELYARRLIYGAMLNGLRRRDPVSERVRRTIRQAEERRYALAQQLGTLPAAAAVERRDPALQRARAAAHRQATLSLDAPLPGGRDALEDWTGDPAREVIARARRRELAQAIALLPERQRRILTMHYAKNQTLQSIGAALHVSPQRVSQLHLRALLKLRHSSLWA